MPKIFIYCPKGTFQDPVKTEMAADLTTIALKLENIPDTPEVRSSVWIFINEYPEGNVLHGDKSAANVISLQINVIRGRLNVSTKKMLIEQFTSAVLKYADMPEPGSKPVYIVIHEVDEQDWGIYGRSMAK